jgi:putative N6-adenine-specific DNA methylase
VDLFATAAPGTEGALRDELRELRFRGVRADRGGVHFHGALAESGRACLESRIAIRVLVEIADLDAPDERALYDGVRSVDWTRWLSPRHTMAVSSVARASHLFHTKFLAQKTKDAIVDQLRDKFGERPSVDLKDADVRVFLHLVKDRGSLFLDASGGSLHRRGYRARIGEAPLKETLAAACLRLAGWDRARPFCDPMCGSGTIAIEAEQWARNVAPGLLHERFGVERWASADQTLAAAMGELRRQARARARPQGPTVIGSDVDARVLQFAKENARAAGADVRWQQRDLHELPKLAPRGCFVLANPPYGLRIDTTREFHREMAKTLRQMRGSTVALVSGTHEIDWAMGQPRKWQTIANGSIEVRLLVYDID